jgi:hypothetical protein
MVSKVRDALEKQTSGESRVCSSGVKIWVRPLPAILLRRLETKISRDNPDPTPPKKTIDVLGGTEEIDDVNNPDYLEQQRLVNLKKIELQGEAILDFCVDVEGGIEAYADVIARIEKRTDEKYPVDPDERRMQFLSEYVIRSGVDWQFVFASAVEQTQATDPEVSERMDSFRDKVARPETNGAAPSGADAVKRLDLQPTL